MVIIVANKDERREITGVEAVAIHKGDTTLYFVTKENDAHEVHFIDTRAYGIIMRED